MAITTQISKLGRLRPTLFLVTILIATGLILSFGLRSPISVELTVFIQGAYTDNGQMSTVLNSAGHLPTNQPFDSAPWHYAGSESVGSIPNGDIVDWVLVELRTGDPSAPPMPVQAQSAAFLKSDGSIVGMDGSSPVVFSGVPDGTYYLVVHHRNHLPVMSSSEISLSSGSITSYDFTSGQDQAYGTAPMANLGNGTYGLIAGDVDRDGQVVYSGPGNDPLSIFNAVGNQLSGTASGYLDVDVNMDGRVVYSGPGNDPLSIFNAVGNHLSASRTSQVPETGTLHVAASTSGDEADSDGYTVTVDGSLSQEIGPNGATTFSGLSGGDHQVELSGIATNCSLDGQNPRTVSVKASTIANTSFSVSCVASSARTAILWEFEEWSLQNSSYSGNPFDLVATATFTHQKSGETRTTEMFYAGGDTWRFRFTGTKTGTWTFTTSSGDPELDGHSGTINVHQNPDPEAHGFVTKSRTDPKKWAWQKGSNAEETFIPQLVMVGGNNGTRPSQIGTEVKAKELISEFMGNHGFNGFHVAVLAGYWFDKNGSRSVPSSVADPDPVMFEALETFIGEVHAAGGIVHIWTWGDAQRTQAASNLKGGIGGAVENRLNRYIAARLGPLPGWTMSYGFDLDEWVSESEIHNWNSFMQSHLGWPHFLGGRPQGPNSGTDHSPWHSWNSDMGYSSYEHHEPNYNVYVAARNEVADQPTMSEDRFRVRNRDKDYTEAQTRRGLYTSTMSGGVANIWGQVSTTDRLYNTGKYSNANQLKTYFTFFFEQNRFRADMQQNTSITNGYALVGGSAEHYVLYRENASSIQVDLSGMNGSQPAIAVDAKASYQEINLGQLDPEDQTIRLPHSSDWVIAVGSF